MLTAQCQETSNWGFEFNTGIPLNLPTPLTIKQDGFDDIELTANYYSKSLKPPVYWVFRLSKWKNEKAWEFEMKHQKLYLDNPPPEVEYFSITHGFNQLLVNRAFKIKLLKETPFIFRVGIGVVIAHPENMIRGKEIIYGSAYFEGYRLSGQAFATSLGKHFNLSDRFYINAETKFVLCHANVKIINGSASVWHSSFEFIAGIGYIFIKK